MRGAVDASRSLRQAGSSADVPVDCAYLALHACLYGCMCGLWWLKPTQSGSIGCFLLLIVAKGGPTMLDGGDRQGVVCGHWLVVLTRQGSRAGALLQRQAWLIVSNLGFISNTCELWQGVGSAARHTLLINPTVNA